MRTKDILSIILMVYFKPSRHFNELSRRGRVPQRTSNFKVILPRAIFRTTQYQHYIQRHILYIEHSSDDCD
jgi:hypothetical protein